VGSIVHLSPHHRCLAVLLSDTVLSSDRKELNDCIVEELNVPDYWFTDYRYTSLSHSHSHSQCPLPILNHLVARQDKVYLENRLPVARDQANAPLSRDFALRARPGLQTFSPAGAGSSLSHSHSHCQPWGFALRARPGLQTFSPAGAGRKIEELKS